MHINHIKMTYDNNACQLSIFGMRSLFTVTAIDSEGTQICEERLTGDFDQSMITEAIALAAFRAGVELAKES